MPDDRQMVEADIRETFGLVPEFFARVPDYLLPSEWQSFKSLQLSDPTAISTESSDAVAVTAKTFSR